MAATLEKQFSDAVIPTLDGDLDGPVDMLGLVDLEPSERERFWEVGIGVLKTPALLYP